MVKVSLVVPMYRCEGYVNALLDNLCMQDFQDMEIICVIDGSPDNTLELVREYAKTDSRIRVFSQEHKNAGAARNLGLSKVQGEYVMFPDADDTYAMNYVSRLYHAAKTNNADLAICQFAQKDHSLGTEMKYCGFRCLFTPKDRLVPAASIHYPLTSICSNLFNKIIRRDMIVSNHLFFSDTISINDVFFNATALLCADNIVLMDDHLITYNFMKQPSSISVSRGKHPEDIITVLHQLYDWLKERDLLDSYLSDYCQKMSNVCRNYSSYAQSQPFADIIARELTGEEPWKTMSDRELKQKAMLYCGATKRNLKKTEKLLAADDLTSDRKKTLHLQKSRYEHEIRNYSEIIRLLREDHSRNISRRDNYIFMRIAQIRQRGLNESIQTIYRKFLNLFQQNG